MNKKEELENKLIGWFIHQDYTNLFWLDIEEDTIHISFKWGSYRDNLQVSTKFEDLFNTPVDIIVDVCLKNLKDKYNLLELNGFR